jgi:5'-nucleotidase
VGDIVTAHPTAPEPDAEPATLEVDREAVEREAIELDSCRILVTNDDGITSPGLRLLARALAEEAAVVIAAPAEDVSGAGTGIGRYEAADPTRLRRTDVDGIEAYALEGPPGLAVMSAALGAFGPVPDLVVSGINAGMNTGTSIVHSGTVGAAITARTFGIRGLAISIAPGERWHWETAVPVGVAAARWLLRHPRAHTLNVNVPGLPSTAVRGARWAEVDEFGHFHVAAADAAGGVLDLDVRDRRSGSDPDSDSAICLGGSVALTLLPPLGAEPAPAATPESVAGLEPLGGPQPT